MMPVLGNSAGLWALASVPAILAIHFLQQRARVARTSTWFLIEKLAPDSVRGRTWDRLRPSWTLWFQLLAALAATWVLVEPRWVREESAQTVVVVLDSSASMGAFREQAIAAAEREMNSAEGLAAKTTWVVMTTSPRLPPLYRGSDRTAASAALQRWKPELGTHELAPALQLARGFAGVAGRSLLVSDARTKVPPDQRAVGVGRPIENVGFAGSSVSRNGQDHVWRAVVKNNATVSQTRTWHIVAGGVQSPAQSVELAPEGLLEISAAWPAGVDEATVVLSQDAFTADDSLPLVRPTPKPLTVSAEGDDGAAEFFRKVAQHVEGVKLAEGPLASLRLARSDAIGAAQESRGGIFWPTADRRDQVPLMKEPVIPERHPLVAGLNWQGWIGAGPYGLLNEPGDIPLLWQDRMPLVFLSAAKAADGQKAARGRKLMLAFDWETSNAGRLPAMVLLAERFLADERDAQRAPYAANFDCGAAVSLAPAMPPGPLTLRFRPSTGAAEEVATLSVLERAELRAPGGVGLFTLSQGEELFVRGAAQFPDSRQGDFRHASEFEIEIAAERRAALEQNTVQDPLAPAWLVCVLGLLIASWWVRSSRIENANPRPGAERANAAGVVSTSDLR